MGEAKISDFIHWRFIIMVKFSIYYEQNSLTLSPGSPSRCFFNHGASFNF